MASFLRTPAVPLKFIISPFQFRADCSTIKCPLIPIDWSLVMRLLSSFKWVHRAWTRPKPWSMTKKGADFWRKSRGGTKSASNMAINSPLARSMPYLRAPALNPLRSGRVICLMQTPLSLRALTFFATILRVSSVESSRTWISYLSGG